MKKDQLLEKSVTVEVYNRIAGEHGIPKPKNDYNWLRVAWFQKGVHTESDVQNFVKIVRSALWSPKGIKPLGRVRVIRD